MPRTRSTFDASSLTPPMPWLSWAESLGESLGRGVARGLNTGLSVNAVASSLEPRKRGRPAKEFFGVVAADKRCSVEGCPRPSRSRGLCSAHYQADRRRRLAKA